MHILYIWIIYETLLICVGYFWNIVVKAENAASYLNALDNLTVAMKENGHDVTMQVFMADTGRWESPTRWPHKKNDSRLSGPLRGLGVCL